MLRFNKDSIRTYGAIVGGLAAAAGGYWGIMTIIGADAFTRYDGIGQVRSDIGIVLNDFEMRSYSDGVLMAAAKVDEVSIWRDRSTVHLIGVTEGEYYKGEELAFEFEANSADYGYFTHLLEANEGGRVWNDEMDLDLAAFMYSSQTKMLNVNGPVEGMLFEGEFSSELLAYHVVDEEFTLGPLTWTGPAADPVSAQRREWQVQFAGASSGRNNVFSGANGTATDGESIIKAEKITWDRGQGILTAEGNVQFYGKDANITCRKAVVYDSEGRIVMTEAVNMLIKARPSAQPQFVEIPPLTPFVPEDIARLRPPAPNTSAERQAADRVRNPDSLRGYPVTIIAERIDYWYRTGSRRAEITGKPFARQEIGPGEWRMAWAHSATFNGEAETLLLKSVDNQRNVRMLNSIGDDFQAQWFQMSTQEGNDEYSAFGLQGTFSVAEEELPQPPGTGGTGGGGGTPPPSITGPIGG